MKTKLIGAICAAFLTTPGLAIAENNMLTAINPPGADIIPGISQAMIIEDGRLMFLSGHVPFGPEGLKKDDFEAQLNQVFANLKATLDEAGTDFSSVARLTFYVRDYDGTQLDTLREVRDRWIDTSNPPASALIGVAALFHPDVLVEVDAIAVLPASK